MGGARRRRVGRWEGRGGVRQEGGSVVVDKFTHFINHHNTFAKCSHVTQMRKPRRTIPVLNN